MLNNFDVLIGFTCSVTIYDKAFSYMNAKIIELNWCAYDLKLKKLTEEIQFFVKPLLLPSLNEETIQQTKITNQMLMKAQSLAAAFKQFIEVMVSKFQSNNQQFCLVTAGKELMQQYLPNHCNEEKINLPMGFHQYFDIIQEFKQFQPVINTTLVTNLKQIQQLMNFQEIPSFTPSQGNCKTIVRLINMMCRNNYQFCAPLQSKQPSLQLNLYQQQQQIEQQQQQQQQLQQQQAPLPKFNQQMGQFKQQFQFSPFQAQQQQQLQQRIKQEDQFKYNSFIIGREPEPFRNTNQKFYIKLVNLPYNSTESTIFQIFRTIRMYKEDLAFSYNSDGQFQNQCFIRLDSKQKFNEILNYPQFKLEKSLVEIKESKERDFNQAKQSHIRSNQSPNSEICEFTQLSGFIKLKNVPKTVDLLTIARLVEPYKVKPNGIKRPLIYGKPATEVYIVLENQEEVLKIQELNMLHFYNSYLEVMPITIKEYQQIITYHFTKQPPQISIQRNKIKEIQKRRKTILAEGIPLTSQKKDICNFFGDFKMKESDITLLTQPKLIYIFVKQFQFSGIFSGNILIAFEDQMEAMRAIKQNNFRNFGNNYIELFQFK